MTNSDWFGLLNLDKPGGITSRDAVNRVQRLLRGVKVGHAGTLDPLAEGVLVLGLGPATRLVEYVQRMPKEYRGTFLLGRSSDTEDIQGQVEFLDDSPEISADQLRQALPAFLGSIQQRPPQYSALKVQGKRAYDLARQGEKVELAPRSVRIDELELTDYQPPEFRLRIRCGSGTYVRSLGRDIAEALGSAAVMSALERTAIGPFRRENALSLETLSEETLRQHLQPPELALAELPRLTLSDRQVEDISHGRTIACEEIACEEIAAVDGQGRLRAILTPRGRGRLKPARVFPSSGSQSEPGRIE